MDPIHGLIPITEIELEIISDPVFQRLRGITQLGPVQFVFPGATHNRFSHCLGTMHVIDRLMASILNEIDTEEKEIFNREIIQTVRIAALTHDIGHVPFSHTLEDKIEKKIDDKFSHERLGTIIIKKIYGELLKEKGIDIGLAAYFIEGGDKEFRVKPKENERYYIPLISLLHSNGDADRLDYLLRDSHFTGVNFGKIDLERIVNFCRLHNGRICFGEKATDALENFLFARYRMYKAVYIHKTAICYNLILRKIYDLMQDFGSEYPEVFTLPIDEDFMKADREKLSEILINLTECSFYSSIKNLLRLTENEKTKKKREHLKKLYDTILFRRPIKNAFLFENFAERDGSEKEKGEYCMEEERMFEELKRKYPELVEDITFLRHDPGKPLGIIKPPKTPAADTGRDENYENIMIVTKNGKTELLLNRKETILSKLIGHHRVLIAYYHSRRKCREVIRKIARERKFID